MLVDVNGSLIDVSRCSRLINICEEMLIDVNSWLIDVHRRLAIVTMIYRRLAIVTMIYDKTLVFNNACLSPSTMVNRDRTNNVL